MYLTKLSPISGDDYKKHQMIKDIFPGDQKVLFQVNDMGITVISEVAVTDSVEIDLSSYTLGSKHPFTLRLNPVTRDIRTKKRIAMDVPLVKGWIRGRLKSAGVEADFQYIREGTRRSVKQGKVISFCSILCFGVLTIIDVKLFQEALLSGVGHGKGIGFGLINVF